MSYRGNSAYGGYGYDAISGVPIKIGELFQPPPRVTLPLNFEMRDPSHLLAEKYDYGIENAVIEFTNAQREATVALETAEVERVGATIEEFTRMDGSSESDTQEEINPIPNGDITRAEGSAFPKPVSNPLLANIGGELLQPSTADTNGSKTEETKSNKDTSLDLTLFENESDPFDTLTLKTLDDRKELESLFPGAQNNNNAVSQQSEHLTLQENSCTEPNGALGVDKRSDEFELDLDSIDITTTNNKVLYSRPELGRPELNKKPVRPPRVHETQTLETITPLPGQISQDSQQRVKPPKPVRPAPPVPRHSPGRHPPVGGVPLPGLGAPLPPINRGPVSLTSSVNNASATNRRISDPIPQLRTSPQNDPIPKTVRSVHTRSPDNPSPPPPYTAIGPSPPPYSLHDQFTPHRSPSSHSNLPKTFSQPELGVGSSPTDRVHSPELRPSSGQAWNPYTPLPPTLDYEYSPPHGGSRLHNPYHQLSKDSQSFVDNMTSMGFPQARAARAVETLGHDDQQAVLDHLCNIETLTEKGFDGDQVEAALVAWQGKREKAEQFLGLFKNFQELGFEETKIREALVMHDNDQDKVLDHLTQCV